MKLSSSSSTALDSERKLVGLSVKKKYYSPNFFTWGNPSDHNTQSNHIYDFTHLIVFRQKKLDIIEKVGGLKSKTYIPPEYKGNRDPNQLPAFLREKLSINTPGTTRENKQHFEGFYLSPNKSALPKERSQSMEGSHLKLSSSIGHSHKRLNDRVIKSSIEDVLAKQSFRSSPKKHETIEYQYLSPKARHQVKEEKFPVLLSSVFLTGMINPEGISPMNEPTVEHIIAEHHSKALLGNETISQLSSEDKKKKPIYKSSVVVNLVEQNRKKEKMMTLIPKEPKQVVIEKMENHMEAAVSQLKLERDNRRKKILKLLKTKHFNLFKPSTINNMHLLKDAFRK